MSFLHSLDITGSALTAERFRTNVILQNLANISTTRTANGEPYRRKQVVFEERAVDFKQLLKAQQQDLAGQGGVRVREVVESQKDFSPVFDPTHPDADENGYVYYPNVNRTEEQVDLMAASSVYGANVSALNTVKALAQKALDIGK